MSDGPVLRRSQSLSTQSFSTDHGHPTQHSTGQATTSAQVRRVVSPDRRRRAAPMLVAACVRRDRDGGRAGRSTGRSTSSRSTDAGCARRSCGRRACRLDAGAGRVPDRAEHGADRSCGVRRRSRGAAWTMTTSPPTGSCGDGGGSCGRGCSNWSCRSHECDHPHCRDVRCRCVRAATGDYPFIDRLQDMHTKALGFMRKAALEGRSSWARCSSRRMRCGCRSGIASSSDRYLKRDELGVIYQMNVVPGRSGSWSGRRCSRRCLSVRRMGASCSAAGVRRIWMRIISGNRWGSFRWRFAPGRSGRRSRGLTSSGSGAFVKAMRRRRTGFRARPTAG